MLISRYENKLNWLTKLEPLSGTSTNISCLREICLNNHVNYEHNFKSNKQLRFVERTKKKRNKFQYSKQQANVEDSDDNAFY